MPNQETKVNLSVADSHSDSRLNVVKLSHVWTIRNFSFFLDKKVFSSPSFSAEADNGIKWRLNLYPKGEDDESKDYISIFLHLNTCDKTEVRAKYEVTIMSNGREAIRSRSGCEPDVFRLGKGRGFKKFTRRDSLFTENNSYLPNDELTLLCEISYAVGTSKILSQISRSRFRAHDHDLSADFRELFESQALTDVVLVLGGKEFRAHRAILAARSSTFRKMFGQRAEKMTTSRIEISDTDENTLEEWLRFIYTGKSEYTEKMTDLLTTIEKHVLLETTSHPNSATENLLTRTRTIDSTVANELHRHDFPLLNIGKFNGEETTFYRWWRDFKIKVHDRQDLSFKQKLFYLGNLLEGDAASAIIGTASEEVRYFKKLGSLFLRFVNVGAMPIDMVLESLGMPKTISTAERERLIEKLAMIGSCSENPRSQQSKRIKLEEACTNGSADRRSTQQVSPPSQRLSSMSCTSERNLSISPAAVATFTVPTPKRNSTQLRDAGALGPEDGAKKPRNSK